MLCFNVPRKTAATLQVWICVILIVASVFASFSPLIVLDVADEELTDYINEILGELNLDDLDAADDSLYEDDDPFADLWGALDEEAYNSVSDGSGQSTSDTSEETAFDLSELVIPDQVEVTSLKLVGSINLIYKLYQYLKVANSRSLTESELAEMKVMLQSEDGRSTVIMAAAIVNAVTSSLSQETSENTSSLGEFLNMFVVFISVLYMMIFTLIAPAIYLVIALCALIMALTKLSDPAAVAAKIGKLLPMMISFPLLFILFQCVIPTMQYGGGVSTLLALTVVCTLVNVVISRLRMYTPQDVKYLNLLQGISLVSLLGYLIFLFNIVNTGVFHAFITGSWSEVVATAALASKYNLEVVHKEYILDAVLIVLAVMLVISSTKYLTHCLSRLSCTLKKGGDGNLPGAIITTLSCILPLVVLYAKHAYEDSNYILSLDAEPVGSFLDGMTASGKLALVAALVGAIITLASEIALMVLKKVLCEDSTVEDREAVVSGTAKTPEEKLATAKETLAAATATTTDKPSDPTTTPNA